MFRPITFLLLCFLATTQLTAQTEKFTPDDQAFFQKTATQYNRWLTSIGLSALMSVEKVALKRNDETELELHLLMKTHDVDEAVAQWRALRSEMARGKADSTVLEKMLYETFVRQMQIRSEQGNIQVYVRDAAEQYIPCFYVGTQYNAVFYLQIHVHTKTRQCCIAIALFELSKNFIIRSVLFCNVNDVPNCPPAPEGEKRADTPFGGRGEHILLVSKLVASRNVLSSVCCVHSVNFPFGVRGKTSTIWNVPN